MKNRLASWRKFANGNVFEACDDGFLADSILDEPSIVQSPHHDFYLKDGTKTIVLDKSAPDYDDMFVERGEPIAADEILETLKPLALKIPLKARSEFQTGELPLSDLLMAIQYYASHLPIRSYSMNESALLTFGMLVEQWADEMVDDNTARMFLEMEEDDDNESYGPPSDLDEVRVEEHCDSEPSDSDIMSIDLEESDTDTDEEMEAPQEASNPEAMETELVEIDASEVTAPEASKYLRSTAESPNETSTTESLSSSEDENASPTIAVSESSPKDSNLNGDLDS